MLRGLTLRGLTLRDLTLRGMTLRGLTLRGLTLRGLTLRGSMLHQRTLLLKRRLARVSSASAGISILQGACVKSAWSSMRDKGYEHLLDLVWAFASKFAVLVYCAERDPLGGGEG